MMLAARRRLVCVCGGEDVRRLAREQNGLHGPFFVRAGIRPSTKAPVGRFGWNGKRLFITASTSKRGRGGVSAFSFLPAWTKPDRFIPCHWRIGRGRCCHGAPVGRGGNAARKAAGRTAPLDGC
jgi:hypothetical protein